MKYFGVGLPRTGTKSLAAVFTMLGLRTQHVVLEGYHGYDAFCDTPVWADWRELVERYPNSKWILTTRDAESWVTSFEKNLLTDYNRLLKLGLNTNQGKRISQDVRAYTKVFGARRFDRELFKRIFIEHHDRVLAYFEDVNRQNLLVLDVANPSALSELLMFLGKQYGDLTFPRLAGGWDGPLNP